MTPIQFETAQKDQVKIFVDSITIAAPQNIYGKKIYPTECRQLKSTYGGTCNIRVGFSVNSGPIEYVEADMGEFPIMIKVMCLCVDAVLLVLSFQFSLFARISVGQV